MKVKLEEALDNQLDPQYAEGQIVALEEFANILKTKVNDLSVENARLLNYIGESLQQEEESNEPD